MKLSTITAVVLIAFGVLSVWKQNSTISTPPLKIDAPSASLQVVVKPITEVLDGHKEQATTLAEFYLESSKTIRREGEAGGRIIKTKSHLRTFCERAATLRFQGVFTKIPGLAAAIHGGDGALSKIIGLEAGLLDYEKSADALHAIAWACQEAK